MDQKQDCFFFGYWCIPSSHRITHYIFSYNLLNQMMNLTENKNFNYKLSPIVRCKW